MASPSTSRLTETVSPNCVNDQPTATDSIGFEPYVQALIAFLTHEQTKPPLVVSIEGPWGSGKSSFMLQLEAKLKEDKQNRTIRFNAWRFEKEESLWAAFALQFTVGLAQALSFWRRQWCHLKILWLRFNFKKGWPSLFRYILLAAAFLYVGFNAGRHIIHDHGLQFFAFPDDKNAKLEELLLRYMLRLGGLAGYAFLGFLLTKKITETIGNPLEMDLKRFLRNPKYDDHIDFIDAFHDDFKKIVETYTPKESRVFVFVDDLDRCEVPKAAELMQALNLFDF